MVGDRKRDVIHAAKEVATLDRISHGRFVFGVGTGWNCEEMADHGTDPRARPRWNYRSRPPVPRLRA
ncbi:LLM class flavin-dependent oxidoreductase [Nocardia vinacea]|uniref:LLM class flavin-dependent oxidoreductase n=1 Tax=Nocardia vinacea TaxID=96468 RepID=UPI003AF2FD96